MTGPGFLPVVLHVDMNAYFASVEQRANPALRGRPIAVVGDLSRRSIVLTASYEARPFGVKTGMLYFEAKKICPGLIPVESDTRKYLAASQKIYDLLLGYSDRIEMVSCDEAFLDVSNGRPFAERAPALARAIQIQIADEIGLPCSVGAASNKLLAKLASDFKKPRGVTLIAPEDTAAFLKDMPVEKISGIGEKLRRSLLALGIKTCGELGAANFEMLYSRFGVWGHWLKRMGQGLDASAIWGPHAAEPVKSVGHSLTFSHNTLDDNVILGYLLLLAEKVGRRMREYNVRGSSVSLAVRFSDFETSGRQKESAEAADGDMEIYKRAARILNTFKPYPKPVRLLSLSVSGLTRQPAAGFLWEQDNKEKDRGRVMDQINDKFGRLTLYHGRVHIAQKHGVLPTPIPPRRHSPGWNIVK
jgi:DNA polymerase-4